MKLTQIMLSLIIIIILIIWCFNNKEAFSATSVESIATREDIQVNDNDITIKVENIISAESKDFNSFIETDYGFEKYNNVVPMEIVFFTFTEESKLTLTKKETSTTSSLTTPSTTNTPTTIGFYLYIDDNDNLYYSNPKTILNIDNIKLDVKYNSIDSNYTILLKYGTKELDSIPKIIFNKKDHITWFVLQHDNENNTMNININNKYFKDYENIVVDIKTITFGDKINAMIGRILVLSKLINEELCNYYYCYNENICNFKLLNKDQNNKLLYGSNNANKCIQECINNVTCNIKECQEICLECQDKGSREWSESEKLNICPWYESIKVLNIDVPNPPIIRGFGGEEEGEGFITVEWKKPYDNNSPINKYILEIVETLGNNNSSIFITIPNNNCEICEYQVNNLKLQTEYDLHLRAVNNRGIGRKSKKINIKTKGNNVDLLKNIYSDISGDYEQTMNYQCDDKYSNSDHILDNIENNDIDIQKYVNANI